MLSNEAAATGVAEAPAISTHLAMSASASRASPATTSPGDRRTISPGKSAAGTSPTSNSPVERSREASAITACLPPLRRLEHRGQVVARLGVEQAVLGQRARRDEANHVAAHHRLRAALPGLGRIFHLLAHSHPEAPPDQPLQVFVGAVDRHAAHGDVLAQMLAALGQHDAERLRGRHRILEEQLVEIAHPVEQQAVRIGGLDLEKLRHRRRHARRQGGRYERGRGVLGRTCRRAFPAPCFSLRRHSARDLVADPAQP